MNVLPIFFMILIFSTLATSLQMKIDERLRMIEPDRVQHSFNQLAMAQYQYYANEVRNGRPGAFAPNIAALSAYLPIWEDDVPTRYGMTSNPNALTLTYDTNNPAIAGRIAARLGAVAAVSGNTITAVFASPIDAALMSIFLPRNGDLPMTGDLNMGNGQIFNINTVTTDHIDANTGEFRNIEITP